MINDRFYLSPRTFHLSLISLQTATKKDSGLTPAQLAWILNQIKPGDDLQPPANISVADLRHYFE